MPAYKDVEVWIEDSDSRKLNHQEVAINLIDDRTVTAKIQMSKGEPYTVHCLSPISVFCDVFVVNASRKRAARFHLDKRFAVSSNASGSSANHTEGQFRDHGLRTPKRKLNRGNLGIVEVEIRRIGEFIKAEHQEGDEVNGDEEPAIEFTMLDDFSQPPWLLFHFGISAKESLAVPAPTAKRMKRHAPLRAIRNQSQTASRCQPNISSAEGTSGRPSQSRKAGYGRLHRPKKRTMEHSVGGDLSGIHSDRLHEAYKKEEAEERRLLRKLREQLRIKKARNLELRRLLGEAP